MFIDTHCHLSTDYYTDINEILHDNKKSGIEKIIISGCEKDSLDETISYINKYNDVYATIGFHPDQVLKITNNDLDYLKKLILANDKIVGIGEIGLDYHYTHENKNEQINLFKKQLDLATELNLPVVIHSRDATLDTIEILKNYNLKGVIHCFSGSIETANIYIKLGYMLGIGGVLTFKNSNLFKVVKEISLKSIVLETDSPYLAPEPFRGKTNSSKYIPIIAQKIAEVKNISLKEVSSTILSNTYKLFDLK